ncbi:dihydrouridine synthase DuS [Oceanithermus profundus DSM 14977]|uniref:tRNA-dihydrouridine synthase n=1 Tax=Oceanithermus profundus (strain DSM 14977 / NBRC 100410 / VKM B-2274 / 506) TaxID=670487 RepID=E4U764_OCEP5|nr:tRNA-dihydrouridine synthase family protein [Oceanithermus profundus]ADR36067.1 dihydrouridine synthase DuS [Oceanithermus profundus DSM 14977]
MREWPLSPNDDGAVLAPMASLTDAPFRLVSERFGALWAVGEMVMAGSLLQESVEGWRLLRLHPEERSRVVQLAGADPGEVARAAARVRERVGPRAIDLNMGCPMPKVTARGAGAALMDDPARAARMVAGVREATGLPVSVKLRLGFSRANAVEVARALEQAGAALLRVHGRTAQQRYGGRADWDAVREVARAVRIPVVGTGDVRSVEDYRARRGLGVGAAVARGALGRPWFFAEVRRERVDAAARRAAAREHLSLHLAWYADRGEVWALRAFRGHLKAYLSAAPAEVRARALALERAEEVAEVLGAWVGVGGT